MGEAKIKAISGSRYGRWTVIEEIEPITKEHFVRVKCDCGNEKIVRYTNLRNGTSKSCGCIQHERLLNQNTKHGFTTRNKKIERLYRIWRGIKNRCLDINDPAYPAYGGRGINICAEWHNDYSAFRKWALANGYQGNLSIDRIDNDKGYNPDNCRWVDRLIQANNTRRNHYVEYHGENHTLAEWERIIGIPQAKIRRRLAKGYSVEDAFYQGDLRRKTYEVFS